MNNTIEVEVMNKLPQYLLSESKFELNQQEIKLFNLNLEELIYEKMFLLFEKLQVKQNLLADAECELQNTKDKILLETDFNKELGKSRTNQAERDAYMKPFLAKQEDKIDVLKNEIDWYKNKITIINDLIKAKRTLLRIEGALQSDD